MKLLQEITKIKRQGYDQGNAEARLCQDIIIHAIRYSIENDSIENFIHEIDCLENVRIKQVGEIEELKQQDYHGKRIHIEISDAYGQSIVSKIDLGVHKCLAIEQEEYCFDISYSEEGVCLLINSKEQMFTEKLCSLLKFGSYSTRHKDIFDMYYLSQYVERDKLLFCFNQYIFYNESMKENSMRDVHSRLKGIFSNEVYKKKLLSTEANWLEMDVSIVLKSIETFIEQFMKDVA